MYIKTGGSSFLKSVLAKKSLTIVRRTKRSIKKKWDVVTMPSERSRKSWTMPTCSSRPSKKRVRIWFYVFWLIGQTSWLKVYCSGMIESQDFPNVRLVSKFIVLAQHPLFPVCWLLILCYQPIKNGTGSTGMETSHSWPIGSLYFQSCLLLLTSLYVN